MSITHVISGMVGGYLVVVAQYVNNGLVRKREEHKDFENAKVRAKVFINELKANKKLILWMICTLAQIGT